MLAPENDLKSRSPIWDAMQSIWLDIDPKDEVPSVAKICAASAYTLEELRAIFLNEVRPALSFNLRSGPAPEWAGFDREWLAARILASHHFGHPLPAKWFNNYAWTCWADLESAILHERLHAEPRSQR